MLQFNRICHHSWWELWVGIKLGWCCLLRLALSLPGYFTLFLTEVCIVREGLRAALRFNGIRWIMETNVTNVVHTVDNFALLAIEASIVDEIKIDCSQFNGVTMQHCLREAKYVAQF